MPLHKAAAGWHEFDSCGTVEHHHENRQPGEDIPLSARARPSPCTANTYSRVQIATLGESVALRRSSTPSQARWSAEIAAALDAKPYRDMQSYICGRLRSAVGSGCGTQTGMRPRVRTDAALRIYLVDRDVPGITRDQLAAAHRAATETARRFTAEGKPVRYLRSLFLPQEGRCLCLFEALDAECVRSLNDAAHIPFTSVTEALELYPPNPKTLESTR